MARAGGYFEVDGDGYLPLQDIPGKSIEAFAVDVLKNRSWGSLASADRLMVLGYLGQLVSAVQAMHGAGYVHRDLSASNVWIGDDKNVYLLDLELAHGVDDTKPPFGMGTPGFMSPAQQTGEPPTCADDVYTVGCVMVLLLTGLDPRRVLFASEKDRVHQLMQLINGAPLCLIEAIAQCTSADPSKRPDLASVDATTTQCMRDVAETDPEVGSDASRSRNRTREPKARQSYEKAIRGAQQALLELAITEDASGLWLSVRAPRTAQDPAPFRCAEMRTKASRASSTCSRASRDTATVQKPPAIGFGARCAG